MTIHPQCLCIRYTLCIHIASTHRGLACEATGQLHGGSSFTRFLPSVKSGSATISIFRALLNNDHRDMSYAAILKPSDLVLGSPQLSYQVRKWRRGRNKEYIPSFPFLTRVLSSLLSCKQSFTSVFHVLNNLPPGKYTTCWEAIPDVWTNLETTLQEQQGFELGNAFPTVQKWWSSFKPLKLTIENKKREHVLTLWHSSGTVHKRHCWFLRFKYRFVLKAQEDQVTYSTAVGLHMHAHAQTLL